MFYLTWHNYSRFYTLFRRAESAGLFFYEVAGMRIYVSDSNDQNYNYRFTLLKTKKTVYASKNSNTPNPSRLEPLVIRNPNHKLAQDLAPGTSQSVSA
jgi:hypothetical protein